MTLQDGRTHIFECAQGHKWSSGDKNHHPKDDEGCPKCNGDCVRLTCPNGCREKLRRKLQPRSVTTVAVNPFESLAGAGERRQECLLHVAWSGLHDPDDDGRGHQRLRGHVIADFGLDAVPTPPFTAEEMERITFAAKMQAIRCLRARKTRKS